MHAFRHTYSTLLNEHGTDVKVQQELLRHADIRTTMNIYTRAVPERLRKANSKLVWLLLQQTQRPSGSERVRCGGSVWESNLRFADSLRTYKVALGTVRKDLASSGTLIAVFSPPRFLIPLFSSAAPSRRLYYSRHVKHPAPLACICSLWCECPRDGVVPAEPSHQPRGSAATLSTNAGTCASRSCQVRHEFLPVARSCSESSTAIWAFLCRTDSGRANQCFSRLVLFVSCNPTRALQAEVHHTEARIEPKRGYG